MSIDKSALLIAPLRMFIAAKTDTLTEQDVQLLLKCADALERLIETDRQHNALRVRVVDGLELLSRVKRVGDAAAAAWRGER